MGGIKGNKMGEETITILKSDYDRLLRDSDWLGYLEAAGVDNWSGYEEAQDMRDEDET